jgi:hypothetical protein
VFSRPGFSARIIGELANKLHPVPYLAEERFAAMAGLAAIAMSKRTLGSPRQSDAPQGPRQAPRSIARRGGR